MNLFLKNTSFALAVALSAVSCGGREASHMSAPNAIVRAKSADPSQRTYVIYDAQKPSEAALESAAAVSPALGTQWCIATLTFKDPKDLEGQETALPADASAKSEIKLVTPRSLASHQIEKALGIDLFNTVKNGVFLTAGLVVPFLLVGNNHRLVNSQLNWPAHALATGGVTVLTYISLIGGTLLALDSFKHLVSDGSFLKAGRTRSLNNKAYTEFSRFVKDASTGVHDKAGQVTCSLPSLESNDVVPSSL